MKLVTDWEPGTEVILRQVRSWLGCVDDARLGSRTNGPAHSGKQDEIAVAASVRRHWSQRTNKNWTYAFVSACHLEVEAPDWLYRSDLPTLGQPSAPHLLLLARLFWVLYNATAPAGAAFDPYFSIRSSLAPRVYTVCQRCYCIVFLGSLQVAFAGSPWRTCTCTLRATERLKLLYFSGHFHTIIHDWFTVVAAVKE